MALKRNERYPGRYSNPTTDHPQGAFKNRTAPSAQDGSYLEQDWANDWDGFFSSLLSAAGITANGNVDTALASQYYNALKALFLQRTNPFGDIKTDGTVNTALSNLGLGTAAKKDVGTAAGQIPDMSSFFLNAGSPTIPGYAQLPNGLMAQWGTIVASANDVTTSFPVLFPTQVIQVYATSGYTPGTGVSGVSSIGTSINPLIRGSFVSRNGSSTLGGRYLAIGN